MEELEKKNLYRIDENDDDYKEYATYNVPGIIYKTWGRITDE
jgi:hypothetical protein